MATQETKRGFPVVEVVVVVVVLMVLVIVLWPVSGINPGKPRQTQCTNNVRQLALAVGMYVQENEKCYPGVNWAAELESYVGSRQIYKCPSDPAIETQNPVSYGYNGLLLRVNGAGVKEEQVLYPTEVGAVCDAGPTREWPGNGIVYGGGLRDSAGDVTPDPRHGGVLIGYCDGRARISPGKKVEVRNINNGVSRAFVQALGLGLLTNYAGGLRDFTPPAKLETAAISFGGDFCASTIMLAAFDCWTAKSSAVCTNLGFKGQDATTDRTDDFLWGVGDGVKPKGNAIPIARDALVLIVAKNCRIPEVTGNAHMVDAARVRQLFTAGDAGSKQHVYSFGQNSGIRRFFANTFATDGKPLQISDKATIVNNDLEMVDEVSGDPFAIGYCSAAFADPERVRILDYLDADGHFHHYPNDNPKYASLLPEEPTWPFMRTLYVVYGGKAWRKDGSGIVNVMLAPGGAGTRALREGPLFKTSYYPPE